MLTLILGNVGKAKNMVRADIRMERSSSKALGGFLKTSEDYGDAIVVPEPGYILEALPYYVENKIYLPRERRFGPNASFTTQARDRLSLGELWRIAREVEVRYEQPVLIVLGHTEVLTSDRGEKKYPYRKVFVWNAEEIAEFKEQTRKVTEFRSAYRGENYGVYALR
jgi:hypothetical protein